MYELKDKLFIITLVVFAFVLGAILGNVAPLNPLPKKQPIIIHTVDNAGAEIFGKVVEKGRHGKLYTVTIRDYGVFVVTKEIYDNVKVGDEVRI